MKLKKFIKNILIIFIDSYIKKSYLIKIKLLKKIY